MSLLNNIFNFFFHIMELAKLVELVKPIEENVEGAEIVQALCELNDCWANCIFKTNSSVEEEDDILF